MMKTPLLLLLWWRRWKRNENLREDDDVKVTHLE
jgi:hypothetical protein